MPLFQNWYRSDTKNSEYLPISIRYLGSFFKKICVEVLYLSVCWPAHHSFDQNNTFLGKRRLCLPLPAAYIPEMGKHSCRHSNRNGKENASCGLYMLHELPQTSTKDCGSWNKVTCWTSKTGGTHSRSSSRTPSAYSRWVLWISTVNTKCRGTSRNWSTD